MMLRWKIYWLQFIISATHEKLWQSRLLHFSYVVRVKKNGFLNMRQTKFPCTHSYVRMFNLSLHLISSRNTYNRKYDELKTVQFQFPFIRVMSYYLHYLQVVAVGTSIYRSKQKSKTGPVNWQLSGLGWAKKWIPLSDSWLKTHLLSA